MPSFRRAVEIGVDVLETDVHMTADGVVVVSHDPDGRREAGVDKPIRDVTLAELRTWDAGRGFSDGTGRTPFACRGLRIPTLDELLEAFPEAYLNIDVKQREPSMVDTFLGVLRNHGATERVTLASFHTDVIRQIRERFDGPTVLAQREVLVLVTAPLALLKRMGVAGEAVQIPVRAGPIDLASRAFISKCHALGLRVDYWTVNDPVVAEILLDRGADGMITDDPARLKPVFERADC
jgi:glycerophosphoryl diester phosphodiesterase